MKKSIIVLQKQNQNEIDFLFNELKNDLLNNNINKSLYLKNLIELMEIKQKINNIYLYCISKYDFDSLVYLQYTINKLIDFKKNYQKQKINYTLQHIN